MNKNNNISISNLKLSSWLMLLAFLLICIIGVWQFILPFLAERHYRDGFNFSASKRYNFAIEELAIAVKYAPWETHYMVELAKNYNHYAKVNTDINVKIEYLNKAVNIFQTCIKYDKLNPWYKNRLSNVYIELEKLVQDKNLKRQYKKYSEQLTRSAAETDSQNPLFLLNLAYYLHRNTKTEADEIEAISNYKKVIAIDGRMSEARYNLAFLYRKNNEYDKALEQYLGIYKNNPNYSKIDLAIASLYLLMGKNTEAIPYLEAKIKKDTTNLDAMKNLTAIYIQTKNWKKASALYEKLFLLYPKEKNNNHIFYIQAMANSGQVRQALEKVNLFLKEYPKDKIALDQKKQLDSIIKEKPELFK
jgi:predicted Zn-dependent protease